MQVDWERERTLLPRACINNGAWRKHYLGNIDGAINLPNFSQREQGLSQKMQQCLLMVSKFIFSSEQESETVSALTKRGQALVRDSCV